MTSNTTCAEKTCIHTHDSRIGVLSGTLAVPELAWGAVLFAQGGGSSCECAYAQTLADGLHSLGLATFLVDLYSSLEERAAERTSKDRVDIGLMTDRLNVATDWMEENFADRHFEYGFVGAGAGAAAVLKAAAERSDIAAVVSCDGLPILAGKALTEISAAVLLIVGECDQAVVEWNFAAYERLTRAYRRELVLIPDAGYPLEADDAVQEASVHLTRWMMRYLGAATVHRSPPASAGWTNTKAPNVR